MKTVGGMYGDRRTTERQRQKNDNLKFMAYGLINRPEEELNLPPYPQSNSVEFWFYFTKYTILQGFISNCLEIVE